MKRMHLTEIKDQDWCPRMFRDAITNYLQFALAAAKPYAAIIPNPAIAPRFNSERQWRGVGDPERSA
jgi:hypothetical protein